jgi:hypothetical protein
MKFALKPIALAVLVATAPLAGITHARAPPVPRAQPSAQLAPPASPATKTPIATKAPEDWIIYDDTTYTPVDEVSRDLAAARKAFDANTAADYATMARSFAKANHALALEHRSKAASSWARKEYDKAGYELKAAAKGLESGAGWVGAEAKAGASSTVTDTRALGDKLASGATWTRDEIVKGFDSPGNSINELGK